MSKIDEKLVVYRKSTELFYYSKNLLKKYPKSERFCLCEQIENTIIEIIKDGVYAWKVFSNKEKLIYLKKIDVNLLILKSLITISYKLQYISERNYMVWGEKVAEIGKLIGSWIKLCQKD